MVDKGSGLSPGISKRFNVETQPFLKLSLIVVSCTDELLWILTFIWSHADKRNVSRRRISNLEKLLEDVKSFLRDEDNLAFSSSLSHLLGRMCLYMSSCLLCEDVLDGSYVMHMHLLPIWILWWTWKLMVEMETGVSVNQYILMLHSSFFLA